MKSLVLFLGVITLAGGFVLGVAYFASHQSSDSEGQTYTAEEETSGYTIEQVPLNSLEDSTPNLSRKVTFSESIPLEAQSILSDKINSTRNSLKEDPYDGAAWLELGLLYHSANDYRGAEEVWLFLEKVLPKDDVAINNLGRLYHFSLHEYAKAEEYFKKAININPSSLNSYLELFDLYRYSYKRNTSAAVDILHEAIQKFPGDVAELYLQLAHYYRDQGNTELQRQELLNAQAAAQDQGKDELVLIISKELSHLP